MTIAGIVCLVLAGAAAGYAYWMHRRHQALAAVETSSCGQMRQFADAANVSAGPGVFRQRCELVGAARAAHVGTVNAPLTSRECVWYRTKVTHEYYDWEWERDSDGDRHRKRVRRSDVIQDDESDIPFAVDDGTGQATIYPDDADIDSPIEVLDRMDADKTDLMDVLSKAVGGEDTIGYRREEWIIPLDQRLFVQGEVTDEGGNLMLRKPEKGAFQVSTRSEQELVKEAQFGRKWASVGGGVLAVIGLGLVIAGLLA
jgi:E3 Ubiquitin ligase